MSIGFNADKKNDAKTNFQERRYLGQIWQPLSATNGVAFVAIKI